MKTYRKKTVGIGFTGYTDAPPDIEKEMDRAVLVKDFLPSPKELMLMAMTQDKQLIDISTTKWYKNMKKKMKPKDYLKHLREAHGLTQKQLGEKIKTSAAHVSDYETGQRSISKSVAKQLCKIFKTSPAIFI
jgi:DNA-binding transcriptional regulator YiaG